jgi:hypothetical protein
VTGRTIRNRLSKAKEMFAEAITRLGYE